MNRNFQLGRGWRRYIACDNEFVDIPKDMFEYLSTNKRSTPAPREKFAQVLKNTQAGQVVTLPSLGQLPEVYGIGNPEKAFLITQQMLDIWQTVSTNNQYRRKRLITGPSGSGKSYLLLFLAAKAYSEGWLLLYLSDSSDIQCVGDNWGCEFLVRFLLINKDILTSEQIEQVVSAKNITLPQEHLKGFFKLDGKILFAADNYEPRLSLFLHRFKFYSEGDNPSPHFILSGKLYKEFEIPTNKSRNYKIEHVRPLPRIEFDRLLELDPLLSEPSTATKIRKFVNYNPRELVAISDLLREKIFKV
ncbi:hypothetical protein BGZ76_005822 [Entomortierella beljakovae]|nr:hypothetical protein BGZ76_005822 [Entomortierella beljakovae]